MQTGIDRFITRHVKLKLLQSIQHEHRIVNKIIIGHHGQTKHGRLLGRLKKENNKFSLTWSHSKMLSKKQLNTICSPNRNYQHQNPGQPWGGQSRIQWANIIDDQNELSCNKEEIESFSPRQANKCEQNLSIATFSRKKLKSAEYL